MLRFIQSKTLTNDLKAIVTSGVCEIGSYIVVYVNSQGCGKFLISKLDPLVAYVWINWISSAHLVVLHKACFAI